uniref:O-methyltransferase n=1 Tax=Panagrolaimus sp. JU765 TaxID=591449 RepID=A0AC34QVJ8_9BILA
MSTVKKSYGTKDPIISYCSTYTIKQSDVEKEIQDKTLSEHRMAVMLGAPEVLHVGKNFIQLIHAKKVLDIGTFTGASAAAWATALPQDGRVLSFDVDHDSLDKIGRPIIKKYPDLEKKITFHLGPALEALDKLIADGEAGTWDFAFIDADKTNYSNYYDRVMKLLRSGGVIFVDNSLWGGHVTKDPSTFDEDTAAIDACNKHIFEDDASNSALLNFGDGTHIAFKK